MKKAIISCFTFLVAFVNSPTVFAEQTETKVNMTVEPTYTISIPSNIQTTTNPSFDIKERDITQFKIKATDVVLPGNSFVEVFVQTKNNTEDNVLINEDGRKLNFNFNRVTDNEYGFEGMENYDSKSGTWKVAEFHPVTHEHHISEVPVTLTTEDILVNSGTYENILIFDISLTADMKETEIVTTPVTEVETIETKDLYEGHEKIIQEALPKIVEIEYDVIYKDGVEVSRKESTRRTIQEGQVKIVEVGTRTEYDDWLDWTETLPSHYVIASDEDFSGTTNGSFRYIGNDDYVVIPYRIKGVKPTSFQNMFRETNTAGVATNFHKVTKMTSMFYNSKAKSLELSDFNTSKVQSMDSMFYGSSATSLDLSDFNTSNVKNMDSMFSRSKAQTLDLSNFNTSNVTNMGNMFFSSSATSLNLVSFDTSKVSNMVQMFYDSKATYLNLSNFDTSKVQSMAGMFNGSLVTYLDLNNFNTSNVKYMDSMFNRSKVQTLDLSSFDTTNVINMDNMFSISLTTKGYARTQVDADRFNGSSYKPSGLNFVIK